MEIKKISEPDSALIHQNVMAKSLIDILYDDIDEGNIEEVLACLQKNTKNAIPGSYLMYAAFVLSEAHKMLRNAHPDDPIVKKISKTEQEIIQF